MPRVKIKHGRKAMANALTAGWYDGIVVDAEHRIASSGNPGLCLTVELDVGPKVKGSFPMHVPEVQDHMRSVFGLIGELSVERMRGVRVRVKIESARYKDVSFKRITDVSRAGNPERNSSARLRRL